jgi:hypothetical protein
MAQVNDVHAATVQTPSAASAGASSWQPLRQPVFRMLWIATVVSNIGSWMNDVGVNWTMLTLSADPLSVALVQAASSLPMFLFALPSGVMADIVDRRKYLLFSQLWVFIAASGLTLLSFRVSNANGAAGCGLLIKHWRGHEFSAVSGHRAGPGGKTRTGPGHRAELARH